MLCIYPDATLITLAEAAQKITAVAGGKEIKKKEGEKNLLKRGAAPQPHLGAGWRRAREAGAPGSMAAAG